MSARLAAAFARAGGEQRPALITLVVPGYPGPAESDAVFDAMVAGGADIIEVEIPFSDPVADGTTIQGVVFDALAAGTTPAKCVDYVRRARQRHPETPIVFMTYLNPVLAYGLERFAAEAAAAGADAVILTDLPPGGGHGGESGPQRPRSQPDLPRRADFERRPRRPDRLPGGRLRLLASAVAGVTGARAQLPADLGAFIARVRDCTNLPLAVGFGVSRREHVESLAGVSDGGRRRQRDHGRDRRERTAGESTNAVREYVEVLSGRRRP